MMEFQHDELSVPARNLVPLLRNLELSEPRSREALAKLLDWDFVLGKASIPAAIYVSFERRLLENVKAKVVPEAAQKILGRPNKKRLIDWLAAPDGRFGEDPIAGRDAVLKASLEEALVQLTDRLGPDMNGWRYGQEKFKHVLIRHPLSAAVSEEVRKKLDVGPAPRGGYDSTLNNTDDSDNQTSGATFRVILDVADWDNSVATSSPGQSGNPENPHYRDLFALWAKHQYFPLFYSREKIESVTENRTVLDPAGATDR
jgi:penicillin amidase